MPDMPRALRQTYSFGLIRIVGTGEETDLHRGGVLRKEREVDATAVPVSA
jgi:hypothetical protein